MPASKRHLALYIALPLVLITALPLAYAWVLISAKLELGGSHPGKQTLGRLDDVNQRAMEQYCTGVVATPKSTWLVGRREVDISETPVPEGVANLDKLLFGDAEADTGGSQANTTYVSRLGDDGRFHEIARFGETACLYTTPDGSSVFLLSGADPENMSLYERWQTVVLRSDDQGNSWRRVKEGFMLPAESLAWSLKPYFHGSDEVWATGMPDQPVEGDEASLGLYYSADRGATAEAIKLGGPLLVNLAFARTQAPADASFGDYNGNEGRWVSHIVQSDANHARIWVSQSFLYGPADGPYLNTPLWFTFVADLLRENGHWQMQPPKRIDGLYIDQLQDNGAGRVIAVISQQGEKNEKVAELSADGLHWKITGELPSPFSPLRANTGLRDFKVGRNVLLANTTSDYQAPRWLSHGSEPATISAESVYYSTDWGASWSRLAIGGYLGVLGFDGPTDRVFWAQGNWYESHDLAVYSDQLH